MTPTSLWFVVPAFKRHELTRLCLKHLRWTCGELERHDVDAQAVVISDERPILEAAAEFNFYAVRQANMPLGRKFNDGIELACKEGADFIVPFGSDNWVLAEMLLHFPEHWQQVVARRNMAIVREDGERLAEIHVRYEGGDGIRTFSAELFRRAGGRPAADWAKRAVDTSIVERLRKLTGWRRQFVYHDVHPLQVIGFQSREPQLNTYRDLYKSFGRHEHPDPWEKLETAYHPGAVAEMAEFYGRQR